MIFLEVAESFANRVSTDLLERAARITLERQAAPIEADLSIVITGDDPLQQLNRQFLGVNTPTDVLSFPADYTDPDTDTDYLGDVLISYPQAQIQATASGHEVGDELQLLVVHGVLHLLGHEHQDAEEKARMWAAQAEILAALGCAHVQPAE